MPVVHIGNEVFKYVVMYVDQHSGYIMAIPTCKNMLLAKRV